MVRFSLYSSLRDSYLLPIPAHESNSNNSPPHSPFSHRQTVDSKQLIPNLNYLEPTQPPGEGMLTSGCDRHLVCLPFRFSKIPIPNDHRRERSRLATWRSQLSNPFSNFELTVLLKHFHIDTAGVSSYQQIGARLFYLQAPYLQLGDASWQLRILELDITLACVNLHSQARA